MNALERFFLVAVLLLAAGGILLALHAVGVRVPFLPRPPTTDAYLVADPNEGDLPPPVPEDFEEDGLLAELGREDGILGSPEGYPDARGNKGGPGWGPQAPGARSVEEGAATTRPGRDGQGRPEGADGKGRDPLVDEMKEKVDPAAGPGPLMAFLISTFKPRGTKLGAEDVDFLLEALAAQEDWGVRNLILSHLERIGGDSVTDGVLAFLASGPDRASAARALGALGALGDESSVLGLSRFLGETSDPRLRQVAFKNLLQTKSGAATDQLLTTLHSTAEPSVKRYALAALSQLGAETGATEVLRYASASDPRDRAMGMKSLRDIRSPAAVPALAAALSTSGDRNLKSEVLKSLGRIRDPGAVASVNQIVLFDPDRRLRIDGIRALAQIGSANALPALATVADQDESAGVRKAAARAARYIEQREASRANR